MGRALHVERSVEIARPAELVRRQFADVGHHERTTPHRGVRFEVVEETPTTCRYRQISAIGPLRLRQELELERTGSGPLVNRVTAGSFEGGEIRFDVRPVAGDVGRSSVTATLHAELSGVESLLAPILRRQVARSLERALDEDRADLEDDRYPSDEDANGV